jgi:hypothetical protein
MPNPPRSGWGRFPRPDRTDEAAPSMLPARSPTPPARGAPSPRVSIVGLVPAFHAPKPASPRTRDQIPSGYGTREHCLPFVEAAACGLAIPSPFSWGVCELSQLPVGARPFRSPVASELVDERYYYVIDHRDLSFWRNEFQLAPELVQRIGRAPVPGLSFFDRSDQQNLLKVHLPYSWQTPETSATLFLPTLNRPRDDGLTMVAGLVETAWYANPVNLVIEIPSAPITVHVKAGEHLAHAILVASSSTRPDIEIVEGHRRAARDRLDAIKAWRESHARQRNAYKRLVSTHRREISE